MASLRRAKNYANEPQTPMFLYAILKQLDLRSIDWNTVAERLDISNGHAARMRYSRMKAQFEGVQVQPRAPRPKKDKDSSKSSSKDKAKGKRLLLQEEEERLAKQQGSVQTDEQRHHVSKRIKLDPPLDVDSTWQLAKSNPYQQNTGSAWSTAAIKVEPSGFKLTVAGTRDGAGQHFIKQETDMFTSGGYIPSVVIKAEPQGQMTNYESSPILKSLKTEPSTTSSSLVSANTYYNSAIDTGFLTTAQMNVGAASQMSCLPQTCERTTLNPSVFAHNRSAVVGMPVYRHSRPVAEHFLPSKSSPNGVGSFSLSPYASSFEDLLNMPLHQSSTGTPSTSDLAENSLYTGVDGRTLLTESTCDAIISNEMRPFPLVQSQDFDLGVDQTSSMQSTIESINIAASADVNGDGESDTVTILNAAPAPSVADDLPTLTLADDGVFIKPEIVDLEG